MSKEISFYFINKILKLKKPKILVIHFDENDENYHAKVNGGILSCIEIKQSDGVKAAYKLFFKGKIYTLIFEKGKIRCIG